MSRANDPANLIDREATTFGTLVNGIFAAGDRHPESDLKTISPNRDRNSETTAREKWPQNSATWRNLACAPVWNWFQCMRFVQARRMATLHPQARIECIKALLIAGRSRSEIGARLGLRRSVVCALVHRLKRDGVALPRSRPGPKPVIIEQFDQLGKVGQGPRQAVNLIDDDHVNLPGADIFQQSLQVGTVG
jgi:hypothetical protein